MLISIPEVLTPDQVREARQVLDRINWSGSQSSSQHPSAFARSSEQLPDGAPVGRQLGDFILAALARNSLFMSAALPKTVFPPQFNRCAGGQSFSTKVDNAIRQFPGQPQRIRTDLSATLFLSDPDEYEGGELCVEDSYGTQHVKLPAGHLILYPSTSLHHIAQVTRGLRVSSFFWLQSLIRTDEQRTLLFDLDLAIQRLYSELPEEQAAIKSAIQLKGVYHNLLRQWAEV